MIKYRIQKFNRFLKQEQIYEMFYKDFHTLHKYESLNQYFERTNDDALILKAFCWSKSTFPHGILIYDLLHSKWREKTLKPYS